MFHVSKPERRHGAAAVELALLIPLILALLLGTWEAGRLIEVNQILDNAAREGGRRASTGALTNAQVRQEVLDYLQNAGLPVANAVVTVQNLTSPSTDVRDATQMDQIRVAITLPFNDVRWIALYLVTDSTTNITADSVWYSVKDKDYPSLADPPIE